jgi:hypothetical protein
MKVLKIPENGEKRYVISILKIIACIHEKYPGLEVQNLGETDLIVTYEMQKTPSKWVHVSVEFVGYQIISGLVFNVITNPQITAVAPVSGLAGNDVTITGQNFYGSDENLGNVHVFFDDYEAVVTSVNSGQIKVQSPVPDAYVSNGYLDINKVTVKYDGREDLVLGDGSASIYQIQLPKVTSVSRCFTGGV